MTRLLGLIQVEKIFWNSRRVVFRLTNLLFLGSLVLSNSVRRVILGLCGRRQNLRREHARWDLLFGGRSRRRYIISADLDVVDEDVGIVHCGRQVV
jgi:hypothetical protein